MVIHMRGPWFIVPSEGHLWGIELAQNFDLREIAHSQRSKPSMKCSLIHVLITHDCAWSLVLRASTLILHYQLFALSGQHSLDKWDIHSHWVGGLK